MFEAYEIDGDLRELRDSLIPDLRVLRCEREFESMPEEWLYELALVTESLEGSPVPAEWIPEGAPSSLRRLAGHDPVIGLPGDGGVTWTVRTEPPLVFVKPRLTGAPPAFCDFLVAEAIVQIDRDHPEHILEFFGERYGALQRAVGDDPDVAYRLAVALLDGWQGLDTRDEFRAWKEDSPALFDAWEDAGTRLADRVESIPELLADGTLGFGAAAELACSAMKHDLEIPPPFAALDVSAYRDHGPEYAIRWTEKTVDQLDSPAGSL